MWCWGGIAPCHLPLPFPPAAEGASPFRPAPCVRVMLPSGTARLDLMALPRRKTGDRCCQGPRRGWEYRDIFFWSCLQEMDSSSSSTVMLPLLTADPDPSQPSSRWVCRGAMQARRAPLFLASPCITSVFWCPRRRYSWHGNGEKGRTGRGGCPELSTDEARGEDQERQEIKFGVLPGLCQVLSRGACVKREEPGKSRRLLKREVRATESKETKGIPSI